MQLLSLLAASGLATTTTARSSREHTLLRKGIELPRPRYGYPEQPKTQVKRATNTIIRQTNATAKYVVNGTAGAIPEVNFDIGESYAGLMPISDKANETSQLYFWFFPSTNPDASDEITIWLNGGPGCSSLEGFLQENGPISWQYGTPRPVYNPWNWANLTNMVWVEQPVGTGFSQGIPTATSQEETAAQFLGFWKNFVDTFALEGRKVYVAGESYAGRYVPYIAEAMLEEKNKTEGYFDVKGILIYDPSIAEDVLLQDIPAVPFLDHHANLMILNASYSAELHSRADKCGYTDYFNKYLTFPPISKLPAPNSTAETPGCAVWSDIIDATMLVNPCFDVYQVATTCPLLWDVLGFPGSFGYLPPGENVYFNRTDVQKAINAPIQKWEECSDGVLDKDTSPQTSYEVIPKLIDALDRTMIVHGDLDFILLLNGSLLAIQNMTWGGVQGFQTRPSAEFYIPYHEDYSYESLSASGVMGVTHTERKLTWVAQALSGHMVPQYQPSSGYRQLEFLLGRVDSLESRVPFTTQPNVPQPGSGRNGTIGRMM
ncbi:carboxypeptidase cpdS precursor [Byssothecium circinans]|uniref:Carboxypeptidase n=1 Tax=Byssothecium circinans TaxID=147558 RepID=A0A6A5U5E2_9PLEO|nr:carboxypeptidase cpdS precursor [Byssothecium circinans]